MKHILQFKRSTFIAAVLIPAPLPAGFIFKRSMKALSAITIAFSFSAQLAHAAVTFVDPGFDGSFDDNGNGNQTLQVSTGEWLNDVEGSFRNWVIVDGAANLGADPGDSRSRALAQSVFDNQANTGLHSFQFDIKISANPVPSNDQLAVYLLGWNDGQTSPVVDLANTNGQFLNIVSLNGATSLLGGNQIVLVDNALTTAATNLGIAADNSFDSVSIGVDLGTNGYDYYAVIFTGEADATEFSIDNVSLTAIPEPAAALLGSLGILFLIRRRR